MAAELIWSPQSRTDLLNIYVIIGLDNPTVAERLYTAIEAKAEAFVHHPRLGPRMLVEGTASHSATYPDIHRLRRWGLIFI
jgi:plasmid stabilization system protein ParE